MSLMRRVYFFKDWNGGWHFWSAQKLHERVIKDTEVPNYDWITSATKIVRICKKRDFPKQYAKEIKVAILKCFTSMENKCIWKGACEPTVDAAVHYCYNSLTTKEEEVVNAKREYLKAMIRKSSLVPNYSHSFYIKGATYLKLQEEWRNKKLDEFVSKKEIDFEQLLKALEADFNQTIKDAEDAGDFNEDDAKWHQEIHNLYASVIDARGGILY